MFHFSCHGSNAFFLNFVLLLINDTVLIYRIYRYTHYLIGTDFVDIRCCHNFLFYIYIYLQCCHRTGRHLVLGLLLLLMLCYNKFVRSHLLQNPTIQNKTICLKLFMFSFFCSEMHARYLRNQQQGKQFTVIWTWLVML